MDVREAFEKWASSDESWGAIPHGAQWAHYGTIDMRSGRSLLEPRCSGGMGIVASRRSMGGEGVREDC